MAAVIGQLMAYLVQQDKSTLEDNMKKLPVVVKLILMGSTMMLALSSYAFADNSTLPAATSPINKTVSSSPTVAKVNELPKVDTAAYQKELLDFQRLQRENQRIRLQIENKQLLSQLKGKDELSSGAVLNVSKEGTSAVVFAILKAGKGKYRAKVFDNKNGVHVVAVGDVIDNGYVISKIDNNEVMVSKAHSLGKNNLNMALPFLN